MIAAWQLNLFHTVRNYTRAEKNFSCMRAT
jgi:hypothetical protein